MGLGNVKEENRGAFSQRKSIYQSNETRNKIKPYLSIGEKKVMHEWILRTIAAVWIIGFLVYLILRKPLPEKTIFFIQIVGVADLIIIFIKSLADTFSYLWLILLCIFIIGEFYVLYKTDMKKIYSYKN